MGQIIADIKKNSREVVRVDVSEFKEKEYINKCIDNYLNNKKSAKKNLQNFFTLKKYFKKW